MINSILNKEGKELATPKTKKPVCLFTTASKEHFKDAVPFFNSLTKFHSPKDIDMILFTNETSPESLQRLPEGIIIMDLTPFLQDQMFWYRQKPILAEPLLDSYDLVIGMDSDQLVLGDLRHILDTNDYDVGTVINWNRFDEKFYPLVSGYLVAPAEYFNCGLVALRSKVFCHHWNILCHSPQFDRSQYKEQDMLNALCYYGNYNVRCFDQGNPVTKTNDWYGIISKGELNRAVIKNNSVMVPQGFGTTPFPPVDTTIRVVHMGGGSEAKKDNWGAFFSPEVMEHIKELVS